MKNSVAIRDAAIALLILVTPVARPSASGAAGLPAAVVCPPGKAAIVGGDAADRLKGKRGGDCLVGGDGDDKLYGKRGNDVIDPGPGIDRAVGGAGDDVFEIRGACEVGRGELISGGYGTDTVRSPLSRAELEALGVRLRSIERFELVASNAGACVTTAAGLACTCCNAAGFDPAAGCGSCRDGFRMDNPALTEGDMIGSPSLTPPACIVKRTCAELACGAHGSCVELDGGPSCACQTGYAGAACDACAPLYDPRADGRCVLGDTCAEAECGGHGRCTRDGAGDVRCVCDAGWDSDAHCGGDDLFVGGPGFLPPDSGPTAFGVALHNGAHCTTDFVWTASAGSVMPDPRDSHRAVFTPPTAPNGAVVHATLRAECGNNSDLGGDREVIVGGPPASGPQPPAISGECDPKLAKELDAEMLAYMQDNELTGGTIAVTYQEQVVCLRGYGYQAESGFSGARIPMQPCTPMRVASVTKPFTRAAFRGNLFGTLLPEGSDGENTPLLPILAPTMGLSPVGELVWQAPEDIYDDNYPRFLFGTGLTASCSSSDGVINNSWRDITIRQMLGHVAGFNPNQPYRFNGLVPMPDDPNAPPVWDDGPCTGVNDGLCGSLADVRDPTVSWGTVTRVPNDLGLDHGVITMDDMTRWMAGICLYDDPGMQRFRYSNVGFTMAGKAIENLTRQTYENYVVGFLSNDGINDLEAPGNPVVYLGQSKGGGPRTYSLPSWMGEADYFTFRPDSVDVTNAVLDDGVWTFPDSVDPPYGATNYDLMASHGGLVMNALALAKFGSTYNLGTGSPRDTARGGPGLTTYDPDNTTINHNGLLWGTFAEAWELPTSDPENGGNKNGPGCLVRDASKEFLELDAKPCPVPEGLRISAIFNDEPPNEKSGLHDYSLVKHAIRTALSRVGTTAAEWATVTPLSDLELGMDCQIKCPPESFCVDVRCGNGVLDEGEECDDGNNESNDECSSDCQTPFKEPNGYEDCEGSDPGTCLGGPCAPVVPLWDASDTQRLDSFSAAHPDGDWSADTFCHDSHTIGLAWEEATCVRTEVVPGKFFGICKQCGIDTMTGCECPEPNLEDGGCNGNFFDGYSCIGGRCWQQPKPPNWMCTTDCAKLYNDVGYCLHTGVDGAVCYQNFCEEPQLENQDLEQPGYCDEKHNAICDASVDGCENDTCCKLECDDDADCAPAPEHNYEEGHICKDNHCVLP
jgi:CubicO group peptidase (beta-lactamase class C family)